MMTISSRISASRNNAVRTAICLCVYMGEYGVRAELGDGDPTIIIE